MEINMMDIHELIDYKDNPRNNDEAVGYVKASIKEFGFKVPIVVDSDHVIIAGHTRKKAALEIGIKEVPVIIADDLTPEQVTAFRLADNKVAEFSEWDMELLQIELNMLEDLNMDDFGFDMSEFTDETETEVEEDDFEEELPEEPKSKIGQVYQLGRHRLMCGDSTSESDVKKLTEGKKMNMAFMDPPYLMNFTGNVSSNGKKSFNSSHGAIMNDKMSEKDGSAFLKDFMLLVKKYVSGSWYICFYRLGIDRLFEAIKTNEMKWRSLIIWKKNNHTLSNSDYMSFYEPIVYGWNDEHNFYGGNSEYDHWEINRTQKNELHPTMKPVALCARAIKNSSEVNDSVLDFFGGSGSTLMACEQTGRKAYLMELDPKYVDVIINRWEQYTGEKAVIL